jgi:hypothetical protein
MNSAISPPKGGTPSDTPGRIVRKGSQASGASISAASRASLGATVTPVGVVIGDEGSRKGSVASYMGGRKCKLDF